MWLEMNGFHTAHSTFPENTRLIPFPSLILLVLPPLLSPPLPPSLPPFQSPSSLPLPLHSRSPSNRSRSSLEPSYTVHSTDVCTPRSRQTGRERGFLRGRGSSTRGLRSRVAFCFFFGLGCTFGDRLRKRKKWIC